MTSDLIKKAKEIRKKINIQELNQNGIKRVSYNYGSILFYYPPLLPPGKLDNPLRFINFKNKPRLYLHIPFCKSKCSYCNFLSAHSKESEVSDYLTALKAEIDLLLKDANQKLELSAVYLGGGTPTCLKSEQISSLIYFLKNKFRIRKNTEVSVEATPESLLSAGGRDKLFSLKAAGVNRLSLGIQCSDLKILKLIGRNTNKSIIISAMANITEAGFKNVNVDLMFGLPSQTLESWESTLKFVLKMSPASVNIRQLGFKLTSNLYKDYSKKFPSDEDNLCMNIMAQEIFQGNGYKERYANYFTLSPKYVLKYLKGASECSKEGISVGASARSYIKPYFYCNTLDIREYIHCINKKKLPISRLKKLSKKEQMRKRLISGIRTSINKSAFRQEFGEGLEQNFGHIFSKFKSLDLIKENKNDITLTRKGCLFADEMCTHLFSVKFKAILKTSDFVNGMISRWLKYR